MDTRVRWRVKAVLLGLLLFGPAAYQWLRLSLRAHQLDRRLAAINTEHERLASLEDRLQHDPNYVESLIRTTFKVSQPGEYVIPLNETTPPGTPSERR